VDSLPNYQLIKKAGVFTANQILVIGINGLTGFYLVRSLPTHEYAWLTVINSAIAALSLILEPLMGSGLQGIVGSRIGAVDKVSSALASAFQARWTWMALASCVFAPLNAYLLWSAKASPWTISALSSLAILAIPFVSGTTIYSTVARVRRENGKLQLIDLIGAVARLVFSLVLVSVRGLASLATVATTLAFAAQFWLARRFTAPGLSRPMDKDADATGQLHAVMRGTILLSFFQCFQAQIGIGILGVIGTQESLAQFGALTRLSFILAPVGALFQQMLIPKLTTLPSNAAKRGKAILGFAFLIAALSAAVVFTVWFPRPLLWLLGPSYMNLVSELPVAMTLFSISTASTIIWWFNSSSGATSLARWVPIASVSALLMVGVIVRPQDTYHVLWFMTSGSLAGLLIGLIQAHLSLSSHSSADEPPETASIS
jgi:hypothetical protein